MSRKTLRRLAFAALVEHRIVRLARDGAGRRHARHLPHRRDQEKSTRHLVGRRMHDRRQQRHVQRALPVRLEPRRSRLRPRTGQHAGAVVRLSGDVAVRKGGARDPQPGQRKVLDPLLERPSVASLAASLDGLAAQDVLRFPDRRRADRQWPGRMGFQRDGAGRPLGLSLQLRRAPAHCDSATGPGWCSRRSPPNGRAGIPIVRSQPSPRIPCSPISG